MRFRASRLGLSLAIGLLLTFGCSTGSGSGSSGGVDDDVRVARSMDDGVTWTAPAALNADASTVLGHDGGQEVATDGLGTCVAVWHSNDFPAQTDFDINVARSTNGGVTWVGEADLNTNAASDTGGDFFPEVTTDGRGTWVATWWSVDSLGESRPGGPWTRSATRSGRITTSWWRVRLMTGLRGPRPPR